jgi:hypothetical protein
MIAEDTGYKLIDEMDFGAHAVNQWHKIIERNENIVVQCPGMCHLLHLLPDDVLVVFMVRPVEDIIASQERINWTEKEEPRELAKYGVEEGPIAKVKYDFWEENRPTNYIELQYGELEKHPLFIEKSKRKKFKPKQTS